jgi:platelet-activating factor acetylhydrolase
MYGSFNQCFACILLHTGFIVLSLEHRDHSASISARNAYKETLTYQPPSGADKPDHETTDEYLLRFRCEQVQYRKSEVREGLELLKMLDEGKDFGNLLKTLVPDFKGRLDWETVVMTGHSFGGATTLVSMQDPEVSKFFQCAISLDPWVKLTVLVIFNIFGSTLPLCLTLPLLADVRC